MSATSSRRSVDVPTVERLIEAEFNDMPGMRLTEPQVRRLWHLGSDECRSILDHLVRIGHLKQDESGRYMQCRGCC
jgi:hypothetical protein